MSCWTLSFLNACSIDQFLCIWSFKAIIKNKSDLWPLEFFLISSNVFILKMYFRTWMNFDICKCLSIFKFCTLMNPIGKRIINSIFDLLETWPLQGLFINNIGTLYPIIDLIIVIKIQKREAWLVTILDFKRKREKKMANKIIWCKCEGTKKEKKFDLICSSHDFNTKKIVYLLKQFHQQDFRSNSRNQQIILTRFVMNEFGTNPVNGLIHDKCFFFTCFKWKGVWFFFGFA